MQTHCRAWLTHLSWMIMSAIDHESRWRGTSDSTAALHARAATTPGQRLAWLEDSLLLAQASGALARDRAQRQAMAQQWASHDRTHPQR